MRSLLSLLRLFLFPDQSNDLRGIRRLSGLLPRVDLFSIKENTERTGGPGTQPNGNTKFTFEGALEAHGLNFEVSSNKAAFNFYGHFVALPSGE